MSDTPAVRPEEGRRPSAPAASLDIAPRGDICSPELTAAELEEMLSELDALCQQARELSKQVHDQMADQKRRDRQVVTTGHFGR